MTSDDKCELTKKNLVTLNILLIVQYHFSFIPKSSEYLFRNVKEKAGKKLWTDICDSEVGKSVLN